MGRKLKPREKFVTGRLKATEIMPYLTAAIMKMVPFEVPRGSLGTFGVTPNGVLLYGPECLEKWSVEEIADTFLHEVGHLLRGHADRADAQTKTAMLQSGIEEPLFRRLWNVAADMELNDDLVDAGRCKEGDWRLPEEIDMEDGQTAEVYLREILDKHAGPPDGPACGSGAGCKLVVEEGLGKTVEEIGRSESEIHQVKKQVAHAIQTSSDRGRGSVPAGWARWADTVLSPPKIDWRTKLSRSIRIGVEMVRGYQDYSYGRPSRRQGAYGWGPSSPIMPAMVAPVPKVAIAVDTSGSMGQKDLKQAAEEAAGVIEAAGARVQFYACDAAVHAATEVGSIDDLLANLKGGGGTSFVPVFDAIDKKQDRPHVLVFITDGGGDAPAHPPRDMHVIWVLVGRHRCTPHFGDWESGGSQPWGEMISVDDDEEE